MKKLKLDVENLAVESFDTVRVRDGGAGTVRGNSYDEFGEEFVGIGAGRTFEVSCYCQTENCATRITCQSCESCRTCTICVPL